LHELCDGDKLLLTKCRLSDDTLFGMLLPESIDNIEQSTCGNTFTTKHISFTNKKRIEISRRMREQVVKHKNKRHWDYLNESMIKIHKL
jgi:hypothetical protein